MGKLGPASRRNLTRIRPSSSTTAAGLSGSPERMMRFTNAICCSTTWSLRMRQGRASASRPLPARSGMCCRNAGCALRPLTHAKWRARAVGGVLSRFDGDDAAAGDGLRIALRIRHFQTIDQRRLASRRTGQLAAHDALLAHGDHYMHLADRKSCLDTNGKLCELYKDADRWARKAVLNIAGSGKFSSDRTVAQYAAEIWNAKPCPVP